MSNSGFNLPGGLKAGPVTIDATTGAITTSGNVRVTGVGKFVGTNAPGAAASPGGTGSISNNVKLLLTMNGADNSTTFTDSSKFARTITRVGNTVLKTSQKKYGTASAYFDGNRDYLTVSAASPDFNFGTGNFTVEFWIYPTALSQIIDPIAQRNDSLSSSMWLTRINTNGSIRLVNKVSGLATVDVTSSNGAIIENSWQHIAIVRNGTSVRVYVNGTTVIDTTLASNQAWFYSDGMPLSIGAGSSNITYAAGSYLTGYIDDVRITKGEAAYTANFTPPDAFVTLATPVASNVKLLFNMNGANGSTVFTDSSNYDHGYTVYGNAQLSTSVKKFGTASAYFDGSGDGLTIPNTTNLDFESSDFTIECWVYLNINNAFQGIFCNEGVSENGIIFHINNSGKLLLQVASAINTYALTLTSTTTLATGTWYHVAAVRNGSGTNNIGIYVNGVREAQGTFASSVYKSSGREAAIGIRNTSASWPLNGYIDDLRVVKGQAVYTYNFIPPTTELTTTLETPVRAEVSLLLNMNGSDNSTTFTDGSAYLKTVTVYGDAKLKTAEKKFGTASAYFDGLGLYGNGTGGAGTNMSQAYLTVPSSTDFDLTGDFTIEFWLKPDALTNNAGILHRGYYSTSSGWTNSTFSVRRLTNTIRFYFYCSVFTEQYIDVTIPDTNWHHWAMVKEGTTARVYRDGKTQGTRININNALSSTRDLKIGLWDYSAGPNYYEYYGGYIDDIRVVKGRALYTGDFTPPAAELTSSPITPASLSDVKLLLNMNGANGSTTFTDSSAYARTVAVKGNAQLSTTVYEYGTASGYFDGAGDYITVPASGDFDFGTENFTIECWIYQLSRTASEYDTVWVLNGEDATGTNPYRSGMYLSLGATSAAFLVSNTSENGWSVNISLSAALPTLNQWEHWAVVRNGSTFTVYKNGISVGTATSSAEIIKSRAPFTIGLQHNAFTNNTFNGYVDDFRITKNQAIYTADFIPPAAELTTTIGTPTSRVVKLLLNMNGTNGSTTFTDSSGYNRTVTAGGNAQLSTGIQKYGTAVAYFDGSGDTLTVPASNDFKFGTGDFTIEGWFNSSSSSTTQRGMFDTRASTTNSAGIMIRENDGGFVVFSGIGTGGYTILISTSSGRVSGAWQHIAVVRASGIVTLYLDGVASASAADTTNYTVGNCRISGFVDTQAAPYGYYGFIDDFRVIKGRALYTANFTPPGAELTITI